MIKHIVLLKFKAEVSVEAIALQERKFAALKSQVPGITSLEWGLNVSPEGLSKGFSHCFNLAFPSVKERDAYLPHPDHVKFADGIGPFLDDVLVIDYEPN